MPKNIERLEKLCQFLDTLPGPKFDFTYYVSKRDARTGCGTVCCAIGWCPAVFPDEWRWAQRGAVVERGVPYHTNSQNPLDQACSFFGLSQEDSYRAFLPWKDTSEEEAWQDANGKDSTPGSGLAAAYAAYAAQAARDGYCLATASPREVAANIRRIMKLPG